MVKIFCNYYTIDCIGKSICVIIDSMYDYDLIHKHIFANRIQQQF